MVDFYDYLNVTRQVKVDLFIPPEVPKLHLTIIHDAQYVRRTTIPSKSKAGLLKFSPGYEHKLVDFTRFAIVTLF